MPNRSQRYTAPLAWALASAFILGGCVTQSTQIENKLPDKPSQASARERAIAHTRLGSGYFGERQLAVALEEAKLALRDDPTYAPAHNLIALVNMEIGENSQARSSFEEGVRLAPGDSDLANNFGWFECERGDPQRGLELVGRAMRDALYPSPFKPLLNAAACHQKLGNLMAAEEHLRRALALQPDAPPALLRMAEVKLGLGDAATADNFIGRFLMSGQVSPESLWLAVRIARGMGDRSREATYVAQLKRRFPESREARVALDQR